jgi:hypothetical protein
MNTYSLKLGNEQLVYTTHIWEQSTSLKIDEFRRPNSYRDATDWTWSFEKRTKCIHKWILGWLWGKYKMLKQQIRKSFEIIEPILEKLKTSLTEILIGNHELGYCKSVELQRLE